MTNMFWTFSVLVLLITCYASTRTYCSLEPVSYNCEDPSDIIDQAAVSLGRVSGGVSVSSPADIPWQAMLRYPANPSRVCSASIIGERWLLTVAHCLFTKEHQPLEPSEIAIVVGEIYRTQNFSGQHAFQVERLIIHPMYNLNLNNFDFDFALVYLSEPLQRSAQITPLCLPTNCSFEPPVDSFCLISGWGKDENGDYKETLQVAAVPVSNRTECKRTMDALMDVGGHLPRVTERMLCSENQHGIDSCLGDGGGPMACIPKGNTDKYVLVGLISWGLGCGIEGTYGIYSRICSVIDWINVFVRPPSTAPSTVPTTSHTTPQPTGRPENKTECGLSGVPHFVPRRLVLPNEFPWSVWMIIRKQRSSPKKQCGGTLVSNRWVLTSSKCVNSSTILRKVQVWFNTTDLNSKGMKAGVLNISVNTYTDLALIKVNRDVPLSPACLPDSCDFSNYTARCVTVGWGTVAGRVKEKKVQKGIVFVTEANECNANAGKICVGETIQGGRCLGDTGSGLVCQKGRSTKYTLYGAIWEPKGRCDDEVSGEVVYSRVCAAYEWIQEIINS